MIQGARNRLLDLSLRNRLINFRPSTRRSLRIVDKDLSRVYQELVLEERALTFKAATKAMLQGGGALSSECDETAEAAESQEETARQRRHRATLQTEIESETLPGRLFRIANEATSVFEEQGYTVLYLALGFLEWKESASSESVRKAPLVLIPVEPERAKVRDSYRLIWTREDIGTNLSLREKLAEMGIALPEFEMPEEAALIDGYFDKVRRAIARRPDWRVVEESYLGFFSFTKFVMYKDLDPAEWPKGRSPSEHPLIRELFAPTQDQSEWKIYDEEEIDVSIDWKSVNHVMDADPSQIVAIESVKAGRNLVVEGPPGTGKSQTIANVIGELLVSGKSVLFVSEKMAALEVVKQRLNAVGLGDFCLEIHSRKARRKEILDELERCFRASSTCSARAGESLRTKLEAQIQELNEYARQLREPYAGLDMSPFRLMEMREQAMSAFEDPGTDIPDCKISHDVDWDRGLLDLAIAMAQQLHDLRTLLKPAAVQAWSGCNPGQLLPTDLGEIRELIEHTRDSCDRVLDQMRMVSTEFRLMPVSRLKQIPSVRDAFDLIANAPKIDRDATTSEAWHTMTPARLGELMAQFQNAQDRRTKALERFRQEALEGDIEKLLDRISATGESLFSLFKKEYRQVIHSIRPLYRRRPSFLKRDYQIDLEELKAAKLAILAVENESYTYEVVFGKLWAGLNTELEALQQMGNWALRFRDGITAGNWTKDFVELVGLDTSALRTISKKVDVLEKAASEAQQLATHCLTRLGISGTPPWGAELSETPVNDVIEQLERWIASLPDLQLWARYADARRIGPMPSMEGLVSLIEGCEIKREEIEPLLNYHAATDQLARVFKERPELAGFVAKLHEGKIDRFRKLDAQIVEANRERVAAELHARRPQLIGGVSPNSGMGVLLREINKKKRHISIRKLMEAAGDIIQRAKPCFMMSPLSIAQFLDPRTTHFDVIVFDEASQVRPEDALGALLRGNQLVVMGDTRQLPPTSFFDRLVEDAEDEEDPDSVGDIESILHLCRRSFPTKQLRWHYRSRHESLIEVSNHEFYDNSLVVYPSPMQCSEGLGLEFRHLPDTIYDRGRSSENRAEATMVARAAIAHYRSRPDLSLGIGAFSTKQQNAIQEEIQRELEEHPEMEGHFSRNREEHFFVKNLETIQGDERDVILLSVGYGKDAYGKLSRNFGPVNHEGGERRLNVLITRARHQCVVFSNFRADDLLIDGGTARGVRALKTFLKYAETRVLDYPQAIGSDSDSPFEDSVFAFLSSEGHEVHKQVGSAGYRIDLALCDPQRPGCYLLGIECDGAKYHSSRVARERDRLRQEVLENLGWTIHRVWSTAWFVNQRIEQERLLRAIEGAMRSPISRPTARKPDAARETAASADSWLSARKSVNTELEIELPTMPYVECCRLSIRMDNDIPSTPRINLAQAVVDVVKVEAPIHVDEVTRRIRALWGLKRSGQRIQEAVGRGIKHATMEKQVKQCGKFLWLSDDQAVVPRRRIAREMLSIELICDEEIASAIHRTLEFQYASQKDAIPTTAARLLGFQQTSEQIRDAIFRVMRRMLKDNALVEKGDGWMDLAK